MIIIETGLYCNAEICSTSLTVIAIVNAPFEFVIVPLFDDELNAKETSKEPEPVVNNFHTSYSPVKYEPIIFLKIALVVVVIATVVYFLFKNEDVAIE